MMNINRVLRRGLVLSFLTLAVSGQMQAYNGNNAKAYALQWALTDTNNNQKCDHVNAPTYSWNYYTEIKRKQVFAINNGNDTVDTGFDNGLPPPNDVMYIGKDFDCANFVSQCLKAGGLSFAGRPGAIGGTWYGVWEINLYLAV